jgi:flagellar biogenesis protein FliO
VARKQLLKTVLVAAFLAAALPAPARGKEGRQAAADDGSRRSNRLLAFALNKEAESLTDNAGSKPDGEDDFPALLGQSLAAVVVILVLGGAAVVVAKRFLPRFGVGQGRQISVRETVYVAPRKSLHLVEVGDRTLLLAGTRERLSLVTDLTGSVESEGRSSSSPGRARRKFVLPTRRPPTSGQLADREFARHEPAGAAGKDGDA